MKNPKSFEEGMERLDTVLDKLNCPDTPLAEALKAYAEAAALISYCENTLKKARVQVEEIGAQLNAEDGALENGLSKEI